MVVGWLDDVVDFESRGIAARPTPCRQECGNHGHRRQARPDPHPSLPVRTLSFPSSAGRVMTGRGEGHPAGGQPTPRRFEARRPPVDAPGPGAKCQARDCVAMDFATHADLTGRLRGLVILLAERLTADQARAADDLIDSSLFGAALESLAEGLSEHGDPDPRRCPPGFRAVGVAGGRRRAGDGRPRSLPARDDGTSTVGGAPSRGGRSQWSGRVEGQGPQRRQRVRHQLDRLRAARPRRARVRAHASADGRTGTSGTRDSSQLPLPRRFRSAQPLGLVKVSTRGGKN